MDREQKNKCSGTGCCRPLFIFWTKAIFVLEIGRIGCECEAVVFLPFKIARLLDRFFFGDVALLTRLTV